MSLPKSCMSESLFDKAAGCRQVTLLKWNFSAGTAALMWTQFNIPEHNFCATPSGECFLKNNSKYDQRPSFSKKNMGKCRAEKALYLDTFRAMYCKNKVKF